MTTPTPRWTAETEELAWQTLVASGSNSWRERLDASRAARQLLIALADAGVLIPVGGETRQERSYSHEWDDSDCVGPEGGCYDGVLVQRTVTEWPDGTELTTPWREVTDDPA